MYHYSEKSQKLLIEIYTVSLIDGQTLKYRRTNKLVLYRYIFSPDSRNKDTYIIKSCLLLKKRFNILFTFYIYLTFSYSCWVLRKMAYVRKSWNRSYFLLYKKTIVEFPRYIFVPINGTGGIISAFMGIRNSLS